MKTTDYENYFQYFEFDERVNLKTYSFVAVKTEYDIDFFDIFNDWEEGYEYDEDEFNYYLTIPKQEIQTSEELEYYGNLWVERKLYNVVAAFSKEHPTSLKIGTLCLILLMQRRFHLYYEYTHPVSDIIDDRFEFLKFYELIKSIANDKLNATSIKVFHGNKLLQKFEFPKYISKQIYRAFDFLPNQESLLYYAEYRLHGEKLEDTPLKHNRSLAIQRGHRVYCIIKMDSVFRNIIPNKRKRHFYIDQLLACIDYMGHERISKYQPGYSNLRKNAIRKIESIIDDHKANFKYLYR